MIDPAIGQVPAHGEAGLAGADDDGRNPLHDTRFPSLFPTSRAGQLTVTCTWVGLVTMSNTADRFWDCATSAAMSSALASALMSK